MISKLTQKNSLDILEFVLRIPDKYFDFYITQNRQRTFLTDLKVIKKILQLQTVYVLKEKEINGVLIIFKEKGYRPYIKLLAATTEDYKKLLKFLLWNHSEELFAKLKNNNPLVIELKKNKFYVEGLRGREILLKKMKEVREIKNGNRQPYQKS